MNRHLAPKFRGLHRNNSTNYKGVTRCPAGFRARIMFDRITVYLGTFSTALEAANAYDAAAIERYGQFAVTNAMLNRRRMWSSGSAS